MYKRMLVPLDGSELAELVFGYAKELAGRLDLDLILLHVSVPGEHDLLPKHRAYIERATEILRRQSAEVQGKTRSKPGSRELEVRGELAEGHAAEEILRYADKNDIDLILMATATGLSQILFTDGRFRIRLKPHIVFGVEMIACR